MFFTPLLFFHPGRTFEAWPQCSLGSGVKRPAYPLPVNAHAFKITGSQTTNLECHCLSKLMTFLGVFALTEGGTWELGEWGEGKYVVILAKIYSLFSMSMAPYNILHILGYFNIYL